MGAALALGVGGGDASSASRSARPRAAAGRPGCRLVPRLRGEMTSRIDEARRRRAVARRSSWSAHSNWNRAASVSSRWPKPSTALAGTALHHSLSHATRSPASSKLMVTTEVGLPVLFSEITRSTASAIEEVRTSTTCLRSKQPLRWPSASVSQYCTLKPSLTKKRRSPERLCLTR